jgi:rod shape determining protein RodA
MENFKEKFTAKIKRIPITIIISVSLVSLYGFVLLYSAAGGEIKPWAYKQISIFFIFLPISILISLIDLRILYHFSYLFYLGTLFLLIMVEFAGKSAMGATRWLNLGLFTIQPSEPVKLALVMALARYFHNRDNSANDITLLPPLIFALIPIILVIKQPDLGTGIIALIVVAVMFFLAGVKVRYFVLCGIGILLAAPAIWLLLHDYQRNRILTFVSPEKDPLGTGYNIIQSKIAIGSGGLFGKGLFSGTQGPLSFLPEYQTDFIFSFLMEEMGFIGGIILLFLYMLIIVSSLIIATNCKSNFARLMSGGIATLFFCHVFVNVAMVMGLVPVVGVPLPLISYGRTMMVSMFIGFGLIMNAAVNQRSNV